MDKFNKLNIGHLILSPHPHDEDKFRANVPWILNWITEKKSIPFYSISEEMGDNNHYHLDIILMSSSDINKNILNDKGKQTGLAGHLKVHQMEQLPASRWSNYYCYRNAVDKNSHEYNLKFLIGYNHKELKGRPLLKNWNNLALTSQEITNCIDFHEENRTHKFQPQKDVITLNPKNCMYEMKKFVRDHPGTNLGYLKSTTGEKDYCWAGMSQKATRTIVLQLKLKSEITQDERDELDEDCHKKFEKNEFESLKCLRYEQDPAIRLKTLYEEEYITKYEYKRLTSGYWSEKP
ncbi:MAG: hypothetical protein [Circular genetic element sp.]|nr:MAG: hypothetical protein [Circular genetic element sp.]